jgi:FlaA1/EpsC-like NDP-sugar epimerase
MLNLGKFISENITFRQESMFLRDIEQNSKQLSAEIKGKSICVIGGAGSIGSSFIKAMLCFNPKNVVVIDLNENGLA